MLIIFFNASSVSRIRKDFSFLKNAVQVENDSFLYLLHASGGIPLLLHP